MIKVLAALFMLIDHIGLILFPQSIDYRIIGRLSMPLFAYSVARGFHYSKQKGTVRGYARKLLIFALVSQVPYAFMSGDGFALNIGFTWLLAVAFLDAVVSVMARKRKDASLYCSSLIARSESLPHGEEGKEPVFAVLACVLTLAVLLPVDYGLYGVLFPVMFYLLLFRWNRPQYVFLVMTLLYALYSLMGGSVIQAFSLVSWPVLLIARRYDDKIKVPRRFFYWFYPTHIAALLAVKALLG